MARAVQTIMICDNPTCTVSRPHEPAEPAEGIFVESAMVHTGGGGGEAARVYACSPECIGPAISDVFTEAWNTGKLRTDW